MCPYTLNKHGTRNGVSTYQVKCCSPVIEQEGVISWRKLAHFGNSFMVRAGMIVYRDRNCGYRDTGPGTTTGRDRDRERCADSSSVMSGGTFSSFAGMRRVVMRSVVRYRGMRPAMRFCSIP